MRGTRATLAVVLATACGLAGAAGGAAGKPAGGAGTFHSVTARPAAVAAYWTAARMRHTRALDVVRSASRAPVDATEPASASPSFVPPAPAGDGVATASLLPGIPPAATASAFSPGNERKFPNRVHGRVFFTYPGQGDFSCSGTVVNSPGRSLVITAGHCVHESGSWATHWVFVPGYRDGNAPYGKWPARALRSTPPWIASEDVSFDIGAVTVARNRKGRRLQNVVGARGIGFDQPRDQTYQSFGYPAELPFDGERLFACRSRYQGDDPQTDPPRTMSINCDMNAGASGGGWVAHGLVLSLNSYCPGLLVICMPGSSTLYGPYFGEVARDLYQRSKGRPRGSRRTP